MRLLPLVLKAEGIAIIGQEVDEDLADRWLVIARMPAVRRLQPPTDFIGNRLVIPPAAFLTWA
jgi:hypothetical protein